MFEGASECAAPEGRGHASDGAFVLLLSLSCAGLFRAVLQSRYTLGASSSLSSTSRRVAAASRSLPQTDGALSLDQEQEAATALLSKVTQGKSIPIVFDTYA